MDEVLTVYAYPPAGTKPQCEKNSDGVRPMDVFGLLSHQMDLCSLNLTVQSFPSGEILSKIIRL